MSQAEWPTFLLRLPTDLKNYVVAQSKKNASSQNSEIIRALREKQARDAAFLIAAPAK